MITIGIDPGITGAIALYDGASVRVWDMPCVTISKGKGERRRIDCGALFDLLGLIADAGPKLAALEEVGGVMNQGANNSFQFGRTFGHAEMALAAHSVPMQLVPPATWKAHFRLKGGKDNSRALASSLIPSGRTLWAKGTHDGRAEAALIALYAYRIVTARSIPDLS